MNWKFGYKSGAEIKHMTTFKNTEADQFLHEVQTWGRALDFYKQENAYLKTRLSQVVDHNHDRLFLASAEHFNNRFVFVDEYIAELMQDVRMQSDLIKKSLSGEKSQDKVMLTLHKKLRGEMEKFEKDLYQLRSEFNKKLVSYFEIN